MKGLNLPKRFTQNLRLAHRHGGVVLSFFLVVLSVTGIMLNHTVELGLIDRSVSPLIAARYYNDEPVQGYLVDQHHVYRVGDTLYFDEHSISVCGSGLTGSVALANEYVVGCGSELILLTKTGEYLERLGAAHGVPAEVTAIGVDADDLIIVSGEQAYRFDTTTLQMSPVEAGQVLVPGAILVPSSLVLQDTVSWEQFILDIHSGQFLGAGGVWLQDFVAVMLVLLGLSGIVMFLLPRPDSSNKN